MIQGTIQRIVELFVDIFQQLGVKISLPMLEELSVIVHKAMTLQSRHYHNLDHVFMFLDPPDPIQSLSALFHDVVYYQVDRGFLPELEEIICTYIKEERDTFSIVDTIPEEEQGVWLTLDIFGFHPGQTITALQGLNEFLSALVMNVKLGKVLSDRKSVV